MLTAYVPFALALASLCSLVPEADTEPQTSEDTAASPPTFEPAGVLFVSDRTGRGRDLYSLPLDGGEPMRLTDFTGSRHKPCCNWPTVSADGRRIAFMADPNAHDRYGIWTMGADGRDPERATPMGVEGLLPSWNPDGTQLAFTGRRSGIWQVFTLDLGTGEYRAITDFQRGASPGWGPTTTWSADGRSIVFHSDHEGDLEIYRMPATGGEAIRLTHSPDRDRRPCFSPDGTQIAFVTDRKEDVPYLCIMTAEGENQRVVGPPCAGFSAPAWSPDGERILFAANTADHGYDVYVLDLATEEYELIAGGNGMETFPGWLAGPDDSRKAGPGSRR